MFVIVIVGLLVVVTIISLIFAIVARRVVKENTYFAIPVVSLLLAGVLLLLGGVYTQDPGEAIVLRSVSGDVIDVDTTPGFGIKAPWVSTVSFDIRNQRIEMFSNDSGTGPDGAAIDLGLKGGASASTSVVVRYSIQADSVKGIYTGFKSADQLLDRELRPAVRDAVRDAASSYEAFTAKENRQKISEDVEKLLRERWEQHGINVEGVDLGNINLDQATEDAIKNVNVSRQKVESARNDLEASRISAEQTKVDAQAQADADQIIRCGANITTSTENLSGKEVTTTHVTPKSGAACEERLNQQVLTSKYLDTLTQLGASGNMVVVVPNDPAGGNSGPILNIPSPKG